MPSPESLAQDEASSRGDAPKLRLVKSGVKRELTAQEREFLPPLLEIQETPPSPVKRWVLWSIIGLVVALIVWATVGKISIVATAPGKFIPDGRVKEVQPLESSIVKAIHVKEGQRVQQGDLLLELDPTLSAAEMDASADKYGFNKLEQERLTAELASGKAHYASTGQPAARVALEERMRQARIQAHAAKLAEAKATIEEKTAALAAAEATLKKYEETTAIAAERESSARPLVDTGAISRVDYLQLKEDLAQNRNDLAAQEKTVQQAEAALVGSQRALEQIERDRVADIYNDLNQRVTSEPGLKGDLDKSKELYALKWLRAPVSGLVQKMDVTTVGQVVTPAQSLVTIVPDGTPLIVEATVSNEDIGYLKVGQPVEVKVDTFPFQRYGSLKGTLISISPDAEDKNAASRDTDTRAGAGSQQSEASRDLANNGPNAGYVYKVHVRTEESHFVVDGEPRPVGSGMTVQADITTDRRRVIDFFLSPVVKYLDEGMKVR
jgi:membrane fusion protein, hemolysin D